MSIIDSQVHVWERDHPGRPWDRAGVEGYLDGHRRSGHAVDPTVVVDGDEMVRRMTAVGIDAAILTTFGAYYAFDNSYAIETAAAHPGRFAVVGRLDPLAPDIASQVEAFAANPGVVAVRALAMSEAQCEQLRSGVFDAMIAAAHAQGLALSIYPALCPGDCERIARAFPDLQILIDHVGLAQPPVAGASAHSFERLSEVIGLARFANVAVKLSGLPTLSLQPYPFLDLWPHIHRVIDAFGPQRVAWGSDTTRTGLDYGEELHYVSQSDELDDAAKELVLGGSLQRLLGWSPGA